MTYLYNVDLEYHKALCTYLSAFIKPERLARMQQVLKQRTRYVCLILEEIYQEHNASAILRTCDAFGIQEVHALERKNHLKFNSDIALGSEQWVSVFSYPDKTSLEVYATLRKKGYKIAATSPHTKAYNPFTIPIDTPLALVMGSEKQGLETASLESADYLLQLPMVGFAESFNVSVSAALALQPIMQRLRSSSLNFGLNETEYFKTLSQWLIGSIRQGKKLAEGFVRS